MPHQLQITPWTKDKPAMGNHKEWVWQGVTILRSERNHKLCRDGIFKSIYINEQFRMMIQISLGYPAGEFHTLQLIVLAAFGVVD